MLEVDPWPSVEVLDYTGDPPERGIDRVLGRGMRADVDDDFVSRLVTCGGLRRLSLRRCGIRTLPALVASAEVPSPLLQLRFLDISHCSQLTDEGVGRACGSLARLEVLRIGFCSQIRQPRPFGGPRLKHLDAVACANLTDAAVSSLAAPLLETLNLSECTALRNPEVSCLSLTHLNLSFCKISDEAVQHAARGPLLAELRLNYSRVVRPLLRPAPALRLLAMRSTCIDGEALRVVFDSAASTLRTVDARDCAQLAWLPQNALEAIQSGQSTVHLGGSPADVAAEVVPEALPNEAPPEA